MRATNEHNARALCMWLVVVSRPLRITIYCDVCVCALACAAYILMSCNDEKEIPIYVCFVPFERMFSSILPLGMSWGIY